MPSLPGYIYATKGQEVYVNLYIGNQAEFELGNHKLKLSQKTSYPWKGEVELEIESTEKIPATFKLRAPGWVRNEVMEGDLYQYIDDQDPSVLIAINGETIEANLVNGYITLESRVWRLNDKINISFDMPVRKVVSHELVKANKGKMALERGPLVFCAEEVDNQVGILNLTLAKNGSFEYQFDDGLFNGVGKIIGNAEVDNKTTSFTAIPYYAWAHREIGEMAVWLNAK